MSKYTTQIRWLVENSTTDMDGQPISSRIAASAPKIFDFYFPIWEEEYRHVLEKKILMHYFNKEIGMETVALWKLYLEERLNLIMPYYNQLYETATKDFDYLNDVNYTDTHAQTKMGKEEGQYNATDNTKSDLTGKVTDDGITTDSSTSNGTLHSLKSDLPQANYAGVDYGTNLQEDETSQKINGTTDSTNTTNTTQNATTDTKQNSTNNVTRTESDNYTLTRKGTTGSRSFTELMMQYRDSLINIDKMVIDELADLFMLIY